MVRHAEWKLDAVRSSRRRREVRKSLGHLSGKEEFQEGREMRLDKRIDEAIRIGERFVEVKSNERAGHVFNSNKPRRGRKRNPTKFRKQGI
jgi:hypothetical protein